LVLPVYDDRGRMRSVRAWCVSESNDPKRLPPSGYRTSGLVLACPSAVALLGAGIVHGAARPRVVVVEGEPDFLTWATRFSDASPDVPAVLGVVAGAWSDQVGARIPSGARVIVRTHRDAAGEHYAEVIKQTLWDRCAVLRAGER
jgi:hypothetical protein